MSYMIIFSIIRNDSSRVNLRKPIGSLRFYGRMVMRSGFPLLSYNHHIPSKWQSMYGLKHWTERHLSTAGYTLCYVKEKLSLARLKPEHR